MDIVSIKAVADLLKPITEPLSRRFLERKGDGGTAITAALESRMAQVLSTADIAELGERMARRSKQMSLRNQLSFENAMGLALELATQTPDARRRPIEADWFSKWSESVQNVSDEMMQSLWAQAFARQADTGSGHVSLRALDTLRLMERADAVNFLRVRDVLDAMGLVLVNGEGILERVIKPECFDALVDLRLVDYEEQLTSVFSVRGGFTLFFELPTEYLREPVKVIKLSARGRELAQTLPADQEAGYAYHKAFDPGDPLLVPRYLSLAAVNFGPRYRVTLAVHGRTGKRTSRVRREPTHEWDQKEKAWRRVGETDATVDAAVLAELERPHEELGA